MNTLKINNNNTILIFKNINNKAKDDILKIITKKKKIKKYKGLLDLKYKCNNYGKNEIKTFDEDFVIWNKKKCKMILKNKVD